MRSTGADGSKPGPAATSIANCAPTASISVSQQAPDRAHVNGAVRA